MQNAAYYWNVFLQTGAPEAYVQYRAAMAAVEQPSGLCRPEQSEGTAPNRVSS